MVVKVKESFEKKGHVKDNDKSKKYILRGQRNTRYYERILSNKNKSYNFIPILSGKNIFKSKK